MTDRAISGCDGKVQGDGTSAAHAASMWPAPLPVTRLCYPCYDATMAFWKPFRVPDLLGQVGWVAPFHRRGSLQDLNSMGTELHPGTRESLHWEGPERDDKHCLPACLEGLPGKVWKPTFTHSQVASLGLGQSLGQGRETHAKSAPAQRGVCHQLPQVNSPGRQRAGPPSWAGRLLPIVPGQAGLLRVGNQANTHKRSPVSTNVTAARPHSPAQTSGSSTPFSAWLARPELAVGTALGFLIQVGHSSTWPREHRVCL